MPRLNVYIPDELADTVRVKLPALNVSKLLQQALAAMLGCHHDALCCAACSTPVDRLELVDDALGRFYTDALFEISQLIDAHGGTAEGAARVVKSVAVTYGITRTWSAPLPRPTRATRRAHLEHKLAALPERARRRAAM